MRRKGRPKKQKSGKNTGRRPGRPRKRVSPYDDDSRPGGSKRAQRDPEEGMVPKKEKGVVTSTVLVVDDGMSEGLHMTTSQVHALGALVACRECGESVRIGVRPTTKGMISEFTVACNVCEDTKSTNTPNLVRERKRKREKKDAVLQKTENINYAHVAAFLDNGLGYSGLRHYCKYFNARCLNEATFIVYARQVISDVVADTEDSLQYSASIVREVFKSQLETDGLVDLTVAFTTTYHQWGSDFCLVAGAVIELTTGLVLDYDVANMYCHVCKINAKKIVSMSPAEMTEWFNKHQDTCEIREWCDELDHDAEEGVKEIEPKYLECFIAKKIWARSIEKFAFRYTTLIHESDEKIHEELSRAGVYGDVPILIDSATSCFSRRKSEHARTSFQTKLKAKCPRERVQTKDRIMYVYSMSIPEYNKFAISSNIKLRQLVKEMEGGGTEEESIMMGGEEGVEQMPNALQLHEVKAIKRLVANGEEEEEEEEEEDEEERAERVILLDEAEVNQEEQDMDDPEELEEEEEEEGMEQEDDEDMLEEDEALAAQKAEEEERRKLEAEWGEDEEEEEEEAIEQLAGKKHIEEIHVPIQIKEESKSHIKEEVLGLDHHLGEEEEEEEEEQQQQHPEEEEEEDQQPQEEDEEVEEVDQLEDEEDEEEEEELEQLRLEDEDPQMEENEEEKELHVEELMQEEEAPPQATSKYTKEENKTTTQEKSQIVPANQGSTVGGLRQIRKIQVRTQQEEISRKRKQDDEEEQDIVVKRSKQEYSKQNSKEENKQKESERDKREENQSGKKEERSKEQKEDKQKVDDKQRQKEDKPKEKEEKQKSDNQLVAKMEGKQKVDIKLGEKKEEKQKTDSKQGENKESIHKTDTKPSDKRDERQKPENKQSEKEEKRIIEKKTTEAKPQEKAEPKERERDTTKQREENPASDMKQKGNMQQSEKAEAGKEPSRRPGESGGKDAGGEPADTRPKVTANATVTEKQ